MSLAYIALGSNLNQPIQQITAAFKALALLPQTRLNQCSSLYRTPPLSLNKELSQPDYINAVAELETALSPPSLLNELMAIEKSQGRKRSREQRWGPRSLDLDILLYSNQIIQLPNLTIPHPCLTERAFVLVPLLEINPTSCLPDGTALSPFLEQLDIANIHIVPDAT